MGFNCDEMMIYDMLLFTGYMEFSICCGLLSYIYSDPRMVLGVDVKPMGLALGA